MQVNVNDVYFVIKSLQIFLHAELYSSKARHFLKFTLGRNAETYHRGVFSYVRQHRLTKKNMRVHFSLGWPFGEMWIVLSWPVHTNGIGALEMVSPNRYSSR